MLNIKKSLLVMSIFLILATVTAVEVRKTEFIVITNPDNKLSISVVDPDLNNEEIDLFEGVAKKSGEYRFTYYGVVDKVKLKARIINNGTGEIVDEKEFGPYTLGTTIVNINFTSSKVKGEELEQTTELTESETSESELTGLAISETFGGFSSVYYYVIGVVLALVIFIIVMRKRMSLDVKSSPTEPNPKKLMKKSYPPAKTEVKVTTVDKTNETSINETEKRIADMQKQLEQIRSEEKLVKLQKQIKLEQQSLKRMQEDSDDGPQLPQNKDNNLDNQQKPF
ncbi:MAG: hypothetical protein AABW71_05165 [Nanoarchaeota archaeon]